MAAVAQKEGHTLGPAYQGVALANRRMRRVLRSWSRIFFSISASVSVSRKGAHVSASLWLRKASSMTGRWLSLNAYVFWCHETFAKKRNGAIW